MRFRRYARGSIVASIIDDHGSIGIRYSDGRGLLRTCDGVPRVVVESADAPDIAILFACIVGDLDRADCEEHGVEVTE